MRATRVIQTTSSIFRNSRQYLHTNEQIFRMMQEAEVSQFAGGQGNRKRKRQQDENHSSKKAELKTNLDSMPVSGLPNDAMTIASLQNRLIKYTEKIEMARKKVSRIPAYRSSI
ncbi:hypothetical protein [Ureibacillus aquaedulcis]|uniref:Uncharacterized protein n=1 Tax=Ureibacillus aquaedulcis TaxID=3058421 RepID=A0ABT8GU44_9BACL|nr:hypothetical protein [Ureibacillus sp. BA0131]MDN4494935.1 hypothetical protein [Ureibacillus sp. BA0131]